MANKKGVKIVTVITSKKVTGGWSRYGGGRCGLIKAETDGKWTCQSCGIDHPNSDNPYMFELFPGEFIRICSKCIWLAKMNHATDFLLLKELVNRANNRLESWYDK